MYEGEGTTVVLLTAEDDPEVASQAFRFGVYGYLVEPFWPGHLLITVMNAPMPIYAKDAIGRYTLANLQADALAGLGEGELVGKTDEAIMSPDTR